MTPLDRFGRALAAIGAGALAIRVVATLTLDHPIVQGDAMSFHQVAQHLADGEGFRAAFVDAPTAEHPPGWEIVLAAADLLGVEGYTSHRLIGALIGTLLVVAIGLLGKRIAGPAVGLAAAAIAAVHPMLWGADVSLMSEPLYGLLLVITLLAATYARERPTRKRAAVLGALIGLSALTRGEALLLLPLLVVPLLWRRWVPIAVAAVACVLVLAPWTIRNLATFDAPVLISTNANTIWIGANCPETYSGSLIGYWSFRCFQPVRAGEDEAEWSVRQRSEGLTYLREHAGRLPAVLPRRLLRTLEIEHFGQSVFINTSEGRARWSAVWGIRAAWVLMLLAPFGAFVLRRRGAPLVEVLAPVALVLVITLVFYGTTRFRYAAEPSLCILAGAALVAAAARLPALRWRPQPMSSGTSRT